MKPYKRSATTNSPYYVQFAHKGRNYQYCTQKTDYNEALAEGMRYAAEVKLGVKLKPVALPGTTIIQQIIDIYDEQALDVKPASRKKNICCLELILSASGLNTSQYPGVLTKQLVIKFQTRGVKEGRSPVGLNSTVRQARSIFSKRCMPLYEELALPDISGFMKHPLLKEPRKQYTLPPDGVMDQIAQDAKLLKTTAPGQYSAFLLAFCAGLRASEVCMAQWSWLRGSAGSYYLDVPASKSSARPVSLADSVVQELKSVSDNGEFIVPAMSPNARRVLVYRKLSKWIRKYVPTGRKTNHELRKFMGSQVATQQGLFAAQKTLGHSNPGVTSGYYADLVTRARPIQPKFLEAEPQLQSSACVLV